MPPSHPSPARIVPIVVHVPWEHADAVRLRAAQRVEIDGIYGPGSEPGTPPTGIDVPVFVVAFDHAGTPVGCGGLRQLAATMGEIKRMYVVPAARGTGTASVILAGLERAARLRGWRTLRPRRAICCWPPRASTNARALRRSRVSVTTPTQRCPGAMKNSYS